MAGTTENVTGSHQSPFTAPWAIISAKVRSAATFSTSSAATPRTVAAGRPGQEQQDEQPSGGKGMDQDHQQP